MMILQKNRSVNNYFEIHGIDTGDVLQIEMLKNNSFRYIADCHFREIDNELLLLYKLDGLCTLLKITQKGSCQVREIMLFLFSLSECLKEMQGYMLSPDSLILDLGYILYDPRRGHYLFMLAPGADKGFTEQFKTVMEDLLKVMDHSEQDYVMFIYDFFAGNVLRDNFTADIFIATMDQIAYEWSFPSAEYYLTAGTGTGTGTCVARANEGIYPDSGAVYGYSRVTDSNTVGGVNDRMQGVDNIYGRTNATGGANDRMMDSGAVYGLRSDTDLAGERMKSSGSAAYGRLHTVDRVNDSVMGAGTAREQTPVASGVNDRMMDSAAVQGCVAGDVIPGNPDRFRRSVPYIAGGVIIIVGAVTSIIFGLSAVRIFFIVLLVYMAVLVNHVLKKKEDVRLEEDMKNYSSYSGESEPDVTQESRVIYSSGIKVHDKEKDPVRDSAFTAQQLAGSPVTKLVPVDVSLLSADNQIILSGERVTVGRTSGAADYCLAVPGISRIHAELIRKDDFYMVNDLNSTNGTYVNFIRISEPVRLCYGDIVSFAAVDFYCM